MRPTGVYGPGTRNKVKAVQAFLRLPVTGTVDRTTWTWIIYAALTKGRR
jgi:peptidoglycan hydrolase-like protein with peptidoglycan-binding domain